MGKTLYLECVSGISGDMTVSALIDLGADQEILMKALHSLKVDGYQVKIGRRKKSGIDACSFDVILEHQHEGHSHHSHQDGHSHDHHHHPHEHQHRREDHIHRNIADIYQIIDDSEITHRAKKLSKQIFEVVAKAEAKAHGLPMEQVHFHEVGAVDSIVDIVAAAVCLDNLNIEEVIVSDLYEGRGHVKCQHGIIPVPVPAVVNIIMEHSLSLRQTAVEGELVTPTGAAIAAAIKTKDGLPSSYMIKKVGLGSGKKNLPAANILRAFLIEETLEKKTLDLEDEGIWVLETNIDDSTGEGLGYTMERLFKKGAKDAFFTPVYMKKNRPAYKLSVICDYHRIKAMEAIIFQHTTTIGIRKHRVEREVLERESRVLDTTYGPVGFKICRFEGEEYYYPEYEDMKAICDRTGLGFQALREQLEREMNSAIE